MKKQIFKKSGLLVFLISNLVSPIPIRAQNEEFLPFQEESAAFGLEKIYYLTNPTSKENFCTADMNEWKELTKIGWENHGYRWTAPTSGNPIYRLYNPNSGTHHYTLDSNERTVLASLGWRDEGIKFHSSSTTNQVPVYRQYNPKTGAHNYTTVASENNKLIQSGWKDEGVAWYGVDDFEITGSYYSIRDWLAQEWFLNFQVDKNGHFYGGENNFTEVNGYPGMAYILSEYEGQLDSIQKLSNYAYSARVAQVQSTPFNINHWWATNVYAQSPEYIRPGNECHFQSGDILIFYRKGTPKSELRNLPLPSGLFSTPWVDALEILHQSSPVIQTDIVYNQRSHIAYGLAGETLGMCAYFK